MNSWWYKKSGLLCLTVNLFAAMFYVVWWDFAGFMGFASSSYLSWKIYKLKKQI